MTADEAPSIADQYARVFDQLLGHVAITVAGIGLDSGLFAALRARPGGCSAEAIAAELGYDRRAVEVWCRSAFAFELVDRDPVSGFRLAPHLDRILLDPTDAAYMGGRIRFANLSHHDARAYLGFLLTGRPVPRSEHNPELLAVLADLTIADAVMITDHVLPQVPTVLERLRSGGRLLELGAGAGQHAVHYATSYPRSAIVGIEYDAPSVEMARRTVADVGLGDRIEIRHGDANELAEQEAFDLATLNVVLHETGGTPEHRNVLARVLAALRPGGAAIVSELPYPDTEEAYREDPDHRRLAGLMIHEALVGCAAITRGQLLLLIEGAGFAEVRVASQPRTSRVVVIARKPTRQP